MNSIRRAACAVLSREVGRDATSFLMARTRSSPKPLSVKRASCRAFFIRSRSSTTRPELLVQLLDALGRPGVGPALAFERPLELGAPLF